MPDSKVTGIKCQFNSPRTFESFIALSFILSARYCGDFRIDESTNTVTGNPANAPSIKELRRSVVNRDKGQDIARNHAEAMKYEDLVKIMDWSYSICPNKEDYQFSTLEDQLKVADHLMFRAYVSTAFTLWSRY